MSVYSPNTTSVQPTFINEISLTGFSRISVHRLFWCPVFIQLQHHNSQVEDRCVVDLGRQGMPNSSTRYPNFDFNATANAAKAAWNSGVLSKIQVADRSNSTRLEMFYSAIYRPHLLPSNRTEERRYWESDEPHFDDFYML